MGIRVINASKKFKANEIFDDVNVNFEEGNLYLIKGYNGSGKTVFLKCICGFYMLTKGDIYQEETKIREKDNYIVDCGIIIESPSFLSTLTLKENLELLIKMNNKITLEKLEKWIDFYDIKKFEKVKYKNLSLGTKQKMALIQAFVHDPKTLILDEPFNALDKESLEKTLNYIKEIKKDRIIIITTHIHDSIQYISDKEYTFVEGKLIEPQK